MTDRDRLLSFTKRDVDREIRRLASGVSGRLFFTERAEMRMLERDITKRQVFNVVRDGVLIGGPVWDTEIESGWKCEYRWITAGVSITVAVKLIKQKNGYCDLVVTAF